MSAYREQETQITDAALLEECLKEKGIKAVERHEVAQPLVGFQGDKRKDVAEVIIRRANVGNSSNDIGFKKQTDGTYKAIISDYDSSKYNTAWMSDLKKKYAEKKIMKVAKSNGLVFVGKKPTTEGGFKMQFVKA